MSEYRYIPTIGHIIVMRDDEAVCNWNAQGQDSAVTYLHDHAMTKPQHRWRIVQVIAEVERGAPIMHTLMDDKS